MTQSITQKQEGQQETKSMVSRIEKTSSRHRYYYFIGNKKNKKEMLKKLRFKIIPYPKGDNKKYNTNCDLNIQNILF